NCWMADKLTQINNSTVTALDLNGYELEQGARVFAENERLKMVYGDVFNLNTDEKFDVITLAASVQYFEDIKKLVTKLLQLLNKDGEVHIVDSNFYGNDELEDAKRRSADYYANLGVSEMSANYFHHTFDELKEFSVEIRKPNIVEKVFLRLTKG